MDIAAAGTEHPRKRKAAATAEDDDDEQAGVIPVEVEDDDDEQQEGVLLAEVVQLGSKHGDGSIYRPDEHPLHELYHLDDRRETRLEPMRVTDPTDICRPCWTVCRAHIGCAMMQIFSLKLSNLPTGAATATAGGPIQLYGFMAVRDLLDPLRNYVFNRSRDDPFTIHDLHSDPFVYLSGPTRGICLDWRVLVEYDIRIKNGQTGRQEDDLPLIDGAATFSELTYIHGAITNWISGDCGRSMDIARALFRHSVEATVEVWTSSLLMKNG